MEARVFAGPGWAQFEFVLGGGEAIAVGRPQVALKVPFSFTLEYSGNAYDFSRDLSTIV